MHKVYNKAARKERVLEITVLYREEIPIISVNGEIIFSKTDPLKKSVNNLVNSGKFHIIIDLKKVTSIDFSGLSQLVSIATTLRKHNGNLKLVNLQRNLLPTFNTAGLTKFFEFFEDEYEAIYQNQINAI